MGSWCYVSTLVSPAYKISSLRISPYYSRSTKTSLSNGALLGRITLTYLSSTFSKKSVANVSKSETNSFVGYARADSAVLGPWTLWRLVGFSWLEAPELFGDWLVFLDWKYSLRFFQWLVDRLVHTSNTCLYYKSFVHLPLRHFES
jgi:hypothetical protein